MNQDSEQVETVNTMMDDGKEQNVSGTESMYEVISEQTKKAGGVEYQERGVFDGRAKIISRLMGGQLVSEPTVMSSDKYWTTMVKDKESCMEYYKLYRPDLPKEMQQAAANAISDKVDYLNEVVEEGERQRRFSETNAKWFRKNTVTNAQWLIDEIEKAKMAGKIQLTMNRIEKDLKL